MCIRDRFLATTRYLDIKDYVEYNKQTFVWQNTVSRAAYGNKHREEEMCIRDRVQRGHGVVKALERLLM